MTAIEPTKESLTRKDPSDDSEQGDVDRTDRNMGIALLVVVLGIIVLLFVLAALGIPPDNGGELVP